MDSPGEENPEIPSLENYRSRWKAQDLVWFVVFVLVTLIFTPRVLSSMGEVVAQGVLDLLWVGFIFFLVTVLHRRSFREAIHWFRNPNFRTGQFVALGATLALGVIIVSSLFPPAEPPPIEKLFSAGSSLYVFALFGVAVAPLIEEIIFRGFIFNVLADLGSTRIAVPATAILFGLVHVPQLWGSWAGIGMIFVVGYVLSFVRDRSNSLIPSFLIHTAYNGTIFVMAMIGALAQGHSTV